MSDEENQHRDNPEEISEDKDSNPQIIEEIEIEELSIDGICGVY